MGWVAPQSGPEQVNQAGKVRVDPAASDIARESVLGIINNWRSAHSFPLNSFQMTLRGRALRVDAGAVVAQRLKRLSSIEAKLRRYPHIKLAQMQDIGGCRAVVSSVRRVEELVALYKQGESKNPSGRHKFIKESDTLPTRRRTATGASTSSIATTADPRVTAPTWGSRRRSRSGPVSSICGRPQSKPWTRSRVIR